MTSSRHERVAKLFHEACELDSAERACFLDEACAGDDELRAEIESLIARDAGSTSDRVNLTDRVRGMVADLASEIGLEESTHIGPYRLLDKLGEGGMGEVWLAEQTEPVRRKVALKVIKQGMDTKQVVARFEAERQALAMMDHPNVAKVLDAGATDTGRPYFVMELVKGVSITEYCDKNKLSTQERLDLFIQVCNAVEHAHQKGIVHRDLKPTTSWLPCTTAHPCRG